MPLSLSDVIEESSPPKPEIEFDEEEEPLNEQETLSLSNALPETQLETQTDVAPTQDVQLDDEEEEEMDAKPEAESEDSKAISAVSPSSGSKPELNLSNDTASKAKRPSQSPFARSRNDSSSEDDDSDSEASVNEFADHPDPLLLNEVSDKKLSRSDIKRLQWWSYLIVLDKDDSTSWKLPFRDGLGRLNRPLLARARSILTDSSLCQSMGLILSRQILDVAKRSFERCWPGQPVRNLVRAMDDEEADDEPVAPIQSTQALLQEAQALLRAQNERKADDGESDKVDDKKPTTEAKVVEVESDVAPNIIMKIRERRRMAALPRNVEGTTASVGVVVKPVLPISTRIVGRNIDPMHSMSATKRELILAAKRKLAEVRQIKQRTQIEVERELGFATELNNKPTKNEEAQEEKDDDDDKDDESYRDENGDSSSSSDGDDDQGEESEESESGDEVSDKDEDKVLASAVVVDGEEELDSQEIDGNGTAQIVSRIDDAAVPPAEGDFVLPSMQATQVSQELITEDAPNVDANDSDNDKSSENEVENEPGNTKEDKNAGFRALLEREAKQLKRQKKSRFVDAEAEESDDEAEKQLGILAYTEKVKGLNEPEEDEAADTDARALLPTDDDLKHIVDTNSDDEGDAEAAANLFAQQLEEKDEQMLKRVQKDLENHSFLNRRRKMLASGLEKALRDDDSDDESDEELELARAKRFEEELKKRMKDAQTNSQSNANGRKRVILGETVEEIEQEQEQTKRFLEMAKKLKRSASVQPHLSASQESSLSLNVSSQLSRHEFLPDQDSIAVLESLQRCTSQSGFIEYSEASSAELSLSQVGFSLQRDASLPAFLPSTSSQHALPKAKRLASNGASRTSFISSTMTTSFVYTKRISVPEAPSLGEVEDESAARPPLASIGNKPVTNKPSRPKANVLDQGNKRRVPLVPVSRLPSAKLLHLTSLVESGTTATKRPSS